MMSPSYHLRVAEYVGGVRAEMAARRRQEYHARFRQRLIEHRKKENAQ